MSIDGFSIYPDVLTVNSTSQYSIGRLAISEHHRRIFAPLERTIFSIDIDAFSLTSVNASVPSGYRILSDCMTAGPASNTKSFLYAVLVNSSNWGTSDPVLMRWTVPDLTYAGNLTLHMPFNAMSIGWPANCFFNAETQKLFLSGFSSILQVNTATFQLEARKDKTPYFSESPSAATSIGELNYVVWDSNVLIQFRTIDDLPG